jgi:hypothetical protein
LPQWNPHVFLGAPFVGAFQSAMFYPPNWIYLLLPVGLATNWLIAGHLFLGGLFMNNWAARRGLHPLASLVAAALLMFCGPQFLRVYAGHLPVLCAMAWIPLGFLAIDEFFKTNRWSWCLVGVASLTMQILAGHPQYCFYTLVTASIYSGLCLVRSDRKGFMAAGLASMLLGAVALSAVQILPAMDTTSESVRSVKLPEAIAGSFSLPPENLVTLLAPGFFGDGSHAPYWGRWNQWETTLFVGVTGLALAIYGAVYGERSTRRFCLPMVVILVLLSLGKYTPLFQVLYGLVPGFDKFRSISRFSFFAAIFLCMLAGIGLDRLLLDPKRQSRAAAIASGVGLLLGVAAAVVHFAVAGEAPADWWQKLLAGIQATLEISISPQSYADPEMMRRFGEFAAFSLAIAAATLIAMAALLALVGARRWPLYAIAALAVAEPFCFARLSRDTFSLSQAYPADVAAFLKEHPGDYRIFDAMNHNEAMIVGAYDIWGYDSLVSLRLAELMAVSQGQQVTDAVFYAHYPRFTAYHPLYRMLRLRYLFQRVNGAVQSLEFPGALPRVQLVQNHRVIKDRDAILDTLLNPGFDPTQTVIVEDSPGIKREPTAPAGTASVIDGSTDYLVIEAHLPAPAILLITDGWSKNWRAESTKADGPEYRVMPANYVLRAIPLAAGDHTIRLEYRSLAFTVGKWISLAALLAYGLAIATAQGFVRPRLGRGESSKAQRLARNAAT